MNAIATFIAAVSMLPWMVFLLSWVLTIGHWENRQYRWPAFLWTVVIVIAFACGAFQP